MRNRPRGTPTRLHALPSEMASSSAASPPRGFTSPVPAVRAAQDAVAAAAERHEVAAARLRAALAAAPSLSPRQRAAQQAVDRARAAAQKAAQTRQARNRAALDAEGDLDAAQAAYDTLATTHEADAAVVVRARVAVDKGRRRVEAARAALMDAEEAKASAEGRLAAAEDHLGSARSEEIEQPVAVLLARVGLAEAERALAAAHEDLHDADQSAALAATNQTVVPEFASLDAFVEDYLLPNWRHRMTDSRWCATWWRHAEAISRLEALWEAFEVLRREPAPGLAIWWRDHLDPHLRALTSPDGTFAGCQATRHDTVHQQQDLWKSQPVPDGLFHTDPDSPRQPRRVTHPDVKGA